MPQTRSYRKVVKGVVLDVSFGADVIDVDDLPTSSANVAVRMRPKSNWIDSLVGLFDDSPISAQILENEKRAREIMDANFVIPE
jgi:hypothetical protein